MLGGTAPNACKHGDAERHRHHLRRRDPVEPIEEVHGVDEPHGAEHEERPLHHERQQIGEQPQIRWQARHHDKCGKRLADKAPRYGERPRIVGKPEHGQSRGGNEHRP